MSLPHDYVDRVYAGVLGKIIGVYLGRPFEGWSYERIMQELGEVNYYVHEKLNVPLIVTDDDISGTFTFLRALEDYGFDRNITPKQIGKTWLNYLVEEQTILWWGGMGNSTEHTAYLRLKDGIDAPTSGSIELNGQVVAEQIGAQIFIDGWAMVAPNDPELAVDFAQRAGSVSHDGEAIYGAQVLAAMESLAFVEPDINTLIDAGLSFIRKNSVIYRMIQNIREWHAKEPDWRKARQLLDKHYGYDIYGGNCHMVPNHGLIILSLLYGDDDFQKTQMIVNTSGWDTDCNAGNVGCLLGIKNGLAGLEVGPDWRTPVADRLYLPTADGGRAISDAVIETYHIVNAGRALQGQEPIVPKNGARFHFELDGSVQGFMSEDSIETQHTVTIGNVEGYSESGRRSLALTYHRLASGRVARIETPTFTPSKAVSAYFKQRGYSLLASPTLYSGQTIQARVVADADNSTTVDVALYIKHYDETDDLTILYSDAVTLNASEARTLSWTVPDTNGQPIAQVGVQICGKNGASGVVYLDYLTWDGAPDIELSRPYDLHAVGEKPTMWLNAWIDGLDTRHNMTAIDNYPESYRIIQNKGRGLMIHGTRNWTDYQASVTMTPHLCKAGGLGVRVQGMQRYYALLIDADTVKIVLTYEGEDTVLATAGGGWEHGKSYMLSVRVQDNHIQGFIDGNLTVEATDEQHSFKSGGIALIVEEGRIACDNVTVRPQ